MFGNRFRLFTVAGIEVRVDASWIFLAILITWSLADGVFPGMLQGLSREQYWGMGAIGALGLFLSILLHEMSHSLVSARFGSPVRGITLFIFGGVAEASEEPKTPKEEFLMALAGPLTSVGLGIGIYGLSRLTHSWNWSPPVTAVLSYLGSINLILAAFNLVPGFPLDGGRLLRSVLWAWKKDLHRATRIATKSGSVVGMLLITLGVIAFLTGNFIGGLWWFLIGLFLRDAAKMSYRQLLFKEGFQGTTVERFINRDVVSVPNHLALTEVVERYFYEYHFKAFPVTSGGELLGCVTVDAVKRVPKARWSETRVEDVLEPRCSENTIGPRADAEAALTQMVQSGRTRLMVAEGRRLVGIVTLRDMLAFLAMKLELDERPLRAA